MGKVDWETRRARALLRAIDLTTGTDRAAVSLIRDALYEASARGERRARDRAPAIWMTLDNLVLRRVDARGGGMSRDELAAHVGWTGDPAALLGPRVLEVEDPGGVTWVRCGDERWYPESKP